MIQVLVETNWVFDWASPMSEGNAPLAHALLKRARADELKLHLPSVCLAEARKVISKKVQPKREFKAVAEFANKLTEQGQLSVEDRDCVRRVAQLYANEVRASLEGLDRRVDSLRGQGGLEIFPLNETMLERACDLATEPDLHLSPFDNAILAALLVRADELRQRGHDKIYLAELDADLFPYTRDGSQKQPLHRLYTAAGVTNFYRDFSLEEHTSVPAY